MTGTRDYERIGRAIAFLDAHAARQPSLDDAAAHVGLSPFHFQRLFLRWAGTTPKRFLQYAAAGRAGAMLREGRTVLDAALDAGLSGPGRLHDLLVSVHAVTPGEMRRGGAGLAIRHGVHDTPFGPARIGVSDRGIVGLAFLERAEGGPGALADAWPRADLIEDGPGTAPWIARVFDRLDEAANDPLPVLLKGTNLQLQVWQALLRIPEGAVTSYKRLAAAVGRPRAARAVAGAVAANPVAYLIPCHRVLRETGALGGYRWGLERKRAMLAREALGTDVPAAAPGPRAGPAARC